jgi:hypothetical protein
MTKAITASVRRDGSYWHELIRRWEAGNLTQAEFCRREGVSIWAFRSWKYRPDKHKPAATRSRAALVPAFLPIRVPAPIAGAALEIVLRTGRLIRVRGDFDAQVLRKLLPILEDATTC